MKPIAEVKFADGAVRTVYEDEEGQFVFDEGEKVRGTWFYVDEPEVVWD